MIANGNHFLVNNLQIKTMGYKFEKGAANGNRNTAILARQLSEPKEKSSI